MTRYLIAGAHGMLGRDLQSALGGREVTALGRAELDVTDREQVLAAVRGHDVVINASAYTQVDNAETDEERAYAVNAIGAQNLALAAAANSARFVQVSTDYVFDGAATAPYGENTPHAPISAYGRTKAAGETLALAEHSEGTFIVRTAWLYGEHGSNFAQTMLNLAKTKETWSVVDDQLGQPTWTVDLARQIVALLDNGSPAGIYHGTNGGSATWYEFAQAILRDAGLDSDRITRTSSAAFVRPAPRPQYSVLGHEAWGQAGLPEMRSWESALQEALQTGALKP